MLKGSCSDSTLVNHLMFIVKWGNYIKTFEDIKGQSNNNTRFFDEIAVSKKFLAHAELMQKGFRKDRAKRFKWRERNLKSEMIKSNCWPEGGTPQLLSIIKK